MHIRVIILQVHTLYLFKGELLHRIIQLRTLIQRAKHEADLTAGIRRDGGGRVRSYRELVFAEREGIFDQLHAIPVRAGLGADDAVGFEGALHQCEVVLLEQIDRGPDGVAAVRDDHVELPAVVLHELEPVAHVESQLFAVEADGHEWEVLFGYFDDFSVDFHLKNTSTIIIYRNPCLCWERVSELLRAG